MSPAVAADPRLGRLHVLVDSLVVAEAALEAGAPTLQVRLKSGTDADRYRLARAIAERCRAAGASCLINDRPDLAVAVDADGVHVGADDLPVPAVRRVVGPDALVGGTARDPETGRRLVAEGASYLGVGPTFPSGTKEFGEFPGLAFVRAAAAETSLPAFAIGGVSVKNVPEVLAAGGRRVAVSGAICRAEDPAAAAAALRRILDVQPGPG